jgi:hypothetical protein
MNLKLLPLFLTLALASSLSSCASDDQPKRKKVVGPDDGGLSKLSWNRPRSWEGNSRFGGGMGGMGMMPTSR